jgi:hypothetical protein
MGRESAEPETYDLSIVAELPRGVFISIQEDHDASVNLIPDATACAFANFLRTLNRCRIIEQSIDSLDISRGMQDKFH